MRHFPQISASLVVLALLVSAPMAHASQSGCADAGLSTLSNEQTINKYDVLRNGKKIGTHAIRFEPGPGGLRVIAETKMEVRILFITAYRYHYVSEELWCENTLQQVTTRVDDNGNRSETDAQWQGDGYFVRRNDETGFIQGPIVSTNHWNDRATSVDAVFNTITGKINAVSVTPDVNTAPRLSGQEYEMRGELNIDTYYDSAGNWQGMVFNHKDGSEIEFRCIDCGNTPEGPA